MSETYRGRIMYRITRPDRQVYIARAVLATGYYAEGVFDTWDDIEIHGAHRCEISERWVTLGNGNGSSSYPLATFNLYKRAEERPGAPAWLMDLARTRGRAYGLQVEAEEQPSGVWLIRVRTPRGTIEVPIIPGDKVEHLLELAGLGATVCR